MNDLLDLSQSIFMVLTETKFLKNIYQFLYFPIFQQTIIHKQGKHLSEDGLAFIFVFQWFLIWENSQPNVS